ncbi:hypothetical protein QAD02_009655 [Eretmocerus hayati]|uniref:Uncharacterized protein n=1 Tax=Eretmocerus hayati TaxID=131215 RepID=A0ACC2NCA9_9HYME|nr:hypothetical protein QAD02_009655 [Eretmocerus hayati]
MSRKTYLAHEIEPSKLLHDRGGDLNIELFPGMQMIVLLIFWGFCINALSANTTPTPAEKFSLPGFEELKNYLSGCKQVQPSNTGISRFLSDERHTIQEPVEIPAETPSLCEPGPSRASDRTGYQEPTFAERTGDECYREQPENRKIQQKFTCDVCDKSFDRKAYRNRHVKSHSNERLYRCKICFDELKSNRNLKEHVLRKHNNEKFYLCDHCGKRFVIKQDYTNHMRLHSRDNPMSCEFCHKKFARKDSLMRHVWAHTGDFPYSCKLCGRGFSRNKDLNKHKSSHTEGKPYGCEFCYKCFKHKSSLTFHVRDKHSGTSNSIGSSVNACVETPRESHVIQDSRIFTGIAGQYQAETSNPMSRTARENIHNCWKLESRRTTDHSVEDLVIPNPEETA